MNTGLKLVDTRRSAESLKSLAGQADWLTRRLEEIWYEFDKAQKKLVYPLGVNVTGSPVARIVN